MIGETLTETDGFVSLSTAGSDNYSRDAKVIRYDFQDYFVSPKGSVQWQWAMSIVDSLISAAFALCYWVFLMAEFNFVLSSCKSQSDYTKVTLLF